MTLPPLHVVGGGNVPTARMRVNATWPLAVLDWDGVRVQVRIRGGRVFGAITLDGIANDFAWIGPVRGSLGTSGVGFRLRDGREWYFWTGQGQRVLTVLAEAGFPVSFEQQKATKVWRAVP